MPPANRVLPAQPGEARQALGLDVGGQVGEPVVGRLLRALGPLGYQPLLVWRLLDIALVPEVPGAHAQEGEARGHRLAVGAVAEGERLPVAGAQAGDQLRDRHRLAVGAKPSRRAAARALWRRDREGGLRLKDGRLGGDGEHVLGPGGVQAPTQLGVLAVGGVAQHRRLRHLPAGGALEELAAELGLGLEGDPLGDLRLAPPLFV